MGLSSAIRVVFPCAMLALVGTNSLKAGAPPNADESKQAAAPASLTANVGELLIRIDGTLLRWTPARIEYAGTLMAVEGSVFSTVMTYPGGKHLGVSHYIDVPGHPNDVEKEEITDVHFYLDGQPLTKLSDTMSISGKSFRMERISKIRTFDVDSRVKLEDGILTQWVRIRTPTAVELQTMFALAVPWNVTMTEFLFGDDAGPRKQGKFNTATTKPSEGLEKNVRWLAVFDSQSGKGGVTYVAAHPQNADAWFQYTDAPAAYRKQRLMSFVDKTVPAGFDGAYCMVTGFFSASPGSWQAAALKRATELKDYAATKAQP